MTERHQSAFAVPASHPALPGHFPGTPVVPGVVVLDWVLKTTELWTQRAASVSGLRQVKFHASLLPAERADVALEIDGDVLRFQVTRGEHLIAQGTFVIAGGSATVSPS
jgi:3-hydroxymyristoyl/3-hydroxydecanoyl-(acyl carrier protein) dehydratase